MHNLWYTHYFGHSFRYNRQFRYEERNGAGYVKGRYGFFDQLGKLQVITCLSVYVNLIKIKVREKIQGLFFAITVMTMVAILAFLNFFARNEMI
jgi:hypothetical protein